MVRVNHRFASRSAHIAVGARHGRDQARPGYLGPDRGGGLLLGPRVRPCRHNRGVKDVLIVEGAPPARERSARGNATGSRACPRGERRQPWPQTTVPTCAGTTRFRNSMRFVSYQDRRQVAAALKGVYTARGRGDRLAGPDQLLRLQDRGQVPRDGSDLPAGLGEVHALPGLTGRCCVGSSLPHFVGGTPSTNAIETASYQLRKDHR